MRKSDGGTRPSSRLPARSLQPTSPTMEQPCANARSSRLTQPLDLAGKWAGSHRYVSAVSLEMPEGTELLKRFSLKSNLRNRVSAEMPTGRGPASAFFFMNLSTCTRPDVEAPFCAPACAQRSKKTFWSEGG
jgi:hypothetical protein